MSRQFLSTNSLVHQDILPLKSDPGSPTTGELWVNNGAMKYQDNSGTPTTRVCEQLGNKGGWSTLPGGACFFLPCDDTSAAGLATPYNRAGTLPLLGTGVTSTTGKFGTAFSFDGSTTQIVSSAAPNFVNVLLGEGSSWSISAWVKTTSTSEQGILCLAGTGLTSQCYLVMNHTNATIPHTYSGQVSFNVNGTVAEGGLAIGTDVGAFSSTSTSVNDGSWHHIVAIKTPTHFYLYIDNALDKSATIADRSIDDSTNRNNNWCIGAVSGNALGAGLSLFTGSIDEVGFFTRQLSVAEIGVLYNLGSAAYSNGYALLNASSLVPPQNGGTGIASPSSAAFRALLAVENRNFPSVAGGNGYLNAGTICGRYYSLAGSSPFGTSYTTLFLPPANLVEPGFELILNDETGLISNSVPLSLVCDLTTSDRLYSSNSIAFYNTYLFLRLISDGVNSWYITQHSPLVSYGVGGNASWVKYPWCGCTTWVCIGSGGGGGNGRTAATGSARCGGGGGGGGAMAIGVMPNSVLLGTEAPTSSPGGLGGFGATDPGSVGGAGGVATFGQWGNANGGAGGNGGSSTAGAGGAGGVGMWSGAAGGSASGTGSTGGGGNVVGGGGGGGGAGGGISSGSTQSAGGAGGAGAQTTLLTGGAAGASGGATPTAPTGATTFAAICGGGGGGSGSVSGGTGVSAAGAAGANYGGGGGGSGGNTAATSGGGQGGSGLVILVQR